MVIFNNETLRYAITDWYLNEEKDKTKYRHISDSDASNVTDMSRLRFNNNHKI